MSRRPYYLVLPALLLLPALGSRVGGWAIVTVEQLPDYVVAGKPLSLAFTVRQHGVSPMKGLQPTVEARAGGLRARASATAASEAGRYVVSLALPQPGDWTLTIHSGFGNSKLTLLPLRAIEAGAGAPAPLGEADQGRRLFVAKGCVGCHVRAEADLEEGESIGPPLTGKRYAADYLKRFLADPAMADRPRSGSFVMPNLNLRPTEISALVAFLNAERRAAQQ